MTLTYLFPGFMERGTKKRNQKMEVSLKVGSVLRVPVLAGFSATSTDTGVINVSVAGNILGIFAVKTGNSWVTLTVRRRI